MLYKCVFNNYQFIRWSFRNVLQVLLSDLAKTKTRNPIGEKSMYATKGSGVKYATMGTAGTIYLQILYANNLVLRVVQTTGPLMRHLCQYG